MFLGHQLSPPRLYPSILTDRIGLALRILGPLAVRGPYGREFPHVGNVSKTSSFQKPALNASAIRRAALLFAIEEGSWLVEKDVDRGRSYSRRKLIEKEVNKKSIQEVAIYIF
jgi:hypothetical protein